MAEKESGANLILSGAKWIMLVNVLQRIMTFILNQSMISWTSPEVFGMAAISLELLLSSLLFLSREGIRLACLRETALIPDDRQRIVNLSWVPSIILVSMLMTLWVFQSKINIFSKYSTPTLTATSVLEKFDVDILLMYCSGALLEVMGEPWFNIFQTSGYYGPRLG